MLSKQQQSINDHFPKNWLGTVLNKIKSIERIFSDHKNKMKSKKKTIIDSFYDKKRLSSGTIRHIQSKQSLKRRQSLQLTNTIQRSIKTSHVKRITMINNIFYDNRNYDRDIMRSFKRQYQSTQEKFLFKNMDRMKLVYSSTQAQIFHNIIGIAVDFIINEDSFWNDEGIKHNIVKDWRNLSKNRTICWIIRRQSTLQKLKQFASLYQLRLDVVFLVRRKNNYLVDYTPITKNLCQTLKKNTKTQITIIQCVRVNEKDVCSYQTYKGRIPAIISNGINIKIGLIRIDQCTGLEKPIQAIIKLTSLKQSLFKPIELSTSIPCFIEQYIKNCQNNLKLNNKKIIEFNEQYDAIEQINAQAKLQQYKRKIISNITRIYGRQHKIQGKSIHYIVGDIIKRNYKQMLKEMIRNQKLQKNKQQRIIDKHNEDQDTTISKQLGNVNYLEKVKLELKYYEFY